MTKQYFKELAAYNVWANNIVISWLTQINEEQWKQNVISSFTSIEQTVLHIVSAENAWFLRLSNQPMHWLANDFKGAKDALILQWQNASKNLAQLIANSNENVLNEKLTFTRLNGDVNTKPFYQLFTHVFNHSTYHRGQLVTMLRQVGFENISSTDLLSFN